MLGVAAIIFAVDQATKFLIEQNILPYQSASIISGLEWLIQFTHIFNTGAAFGTFQQFGGVFTVLAFMVIFGILITIMTTPRMFGQFWSRFAAGLALGGAAGNLWDRLTRGYVVDFVDIGFLPIFNMADLAIVTGILILAYFLWDDDDPVTNPVQTANQPMESSQ